LVLGKITKNLNYFKQKCLFLLQCVMHGDIIFVSSDVNKGYIFLIMTFRLLSIKLFYFRENQNKWSYIRDRYNLYLKKIQRMFSEGNTFLYDCDF